MGGGRGRRLAVACALSVISFLLIQKFFALLKSDHNDNYTSVAQRRVATSTLCGKIYVRMWSDKRLAEWGVATLPTQVPQRAAPWSVECAAVSRSCGRREGGVRVGREQVMQPLLLG